MLRNAFVATAICLLVVLGFLVAMGFTGRDMLRFWETPFPVAIEKGEYLSGLDLRVPGKTMSGMYLLTLKVRNPTPRWLELRGAWSEVPANCNITPQEIRVRVPPRRTLTQDVVLDVASGKGQAGVLAAEFRGPMFRGEWHWTRSPASATGGRGAELVKPIERRLLVGRAFGTLNHSVLIAYYVAMMLVGLWCARGTETARSFFVADGSMNYVVVGISILGTYLSALTMMGLPAMSYGEHDWTYMVQPPCLILTAMITTRLVLPRYRAAGIVSVYEYLERRIHVSARLAGALCFIVFSIGRMGLVLYLPALAFSTVTGVPLWISIAVMGGVTTAYTVIGGMKAVIWNDVIQVGIFVIGALLTVGYILFDLGATRFLDLAIEYNKLRTVVPEFDPTKIVTAWLVLETIFQTVRIYGTQQDMTQRYLTTPSTETANRSVWISIVGYIPLGFIFYFSGTALFAFYKAHPAVTPPVRVDQVYPFFVVNHLPEGIAGLVIAAIFAAAMSSTDACMNSSSTVCIEDFWRRFSKKQRSEEYYLKLARWLTLLWGVAHILLALSFMSIAYAQIVWGKIMGISTNGVLGLMALAFLPVKINKWAAGAGFVTSYVVLFLMMGGGVNFLLWPVIGNLVCFFVGLFLSPLFNAAERLEAQPTK